MNKYEILQDDKIEIEGHTHYRIKALKDFGNVEAGDYLVYKFPTWSW